MTDTKSDARVIRPGDPDHPAEQVKAAGAEPEPEQRVAVYQSRISLYADDPNADLRNADVNEIVKAAFADRGFTVNVSTSRTDR